MVQSVLKIAPISPRDRGKGISLQQRIYRGTIEAEGMADFLVRHYSQDQGLPRTGTSLIHHDIQAQKIGNDGSFIVQIGHGKDPMEMRHIVLTVAIAPIQDEEPGVVVTVGQRTWLTPDELKNAALWVLIGALITPFALFGLLWPLSDVLSDSTLPEDVWTTVDVYAASMGTNGTEIQPLQHPQFGV